MEPTLSSLSILSLLFRLVGNMSHHTDGGLRLTFLIHYLLAILITVCLPYNVKRHSSNVVGVHHCLCPFFFNSTDFVQQGDCILFRHCMYWIKLCIAVVVRRDDTIISSGYQYPSFTPIIISRMWQGEMKSGKTLSIECMRNENLYNRVRSKFEWQQLTSRIYSINNQKPIWSSLSKFSLHVH